MPLNFMDIDLGVNEDQVSHSSKILGFPKKDKEKAMLSNRGKLNALRFLGPAPAKDLVVSPQNNMRANLFLTKAFGAPGVTFTGDWNTSSSFCLTYWQWGLGMWAQQEPV